MSKKNAAKVRNAKTNAIMASFIKARFSEFFCIGYFTACFSIFAMSVLSIVPLKASDCAPVAVVLTGSAVWAVDVHPRAALLSKQWVRAMANPSALNPFREDAFSKALRRAFSSSRVKTNLSLLSPSNFRPRV